MSDDLLFPELLAQICGPPIHEGKTRTWVFNSAPLPQTFTLTGRVAVPLVRLVRIEWAADGAVTPTFRGRVPHRKGRPVWRAHTRAHWGRHG